MLQNQAEDIHEKSDDMRQTGGILEYILKANALATQIQD